MVVHGGVELRLIGGRSEETVPLSAGLVGAIIVVRGQFPYTLIGKLSLPITVFIKYCLVSRV